MATVRDIYNFIDEIAPFSTQEEWDNSGLLVGDENAEVKKIALCLDATGETLRQALEFGADLLITHHPIIWEPLKFVPSDTLVSKAIREGLNVISCHTNWDLAEAGVSCVLASLLGLDNIDKLELEGDLAMVRVGTLPMPMTARDLAGLVSDALDAVVSVTSPDKEISTVAVCGGAGACFLPDIKRHGIDAFVTGEAKHNEYLDARELDVSLLCAGHYETETVSMPVLKNLLKAEFDSIEYLYVEDAPVEYIG